MDNTENPAFIKQTIWYIVWLGVVKQNTCFMLISYTLFRCHPNKIQQDIEIPLKFRKL